MTIPHVPSNPERIAYASEQNALIDQCNETTTQTDAQQTTLDGHTSTLSTYGTRLTSLEAAPPAHTHPISQVTSLQTTLDGKAATSHTHALPIDALTDVDTTTVAPVSGQVLKWTGSIWAPGNDLTGGGTGGPTTLDGLDDVAITTPTSGQVIVYNGTTWLNVAAPVASATYRGQWTDANNGAGTQILNASGGGGAGVKVTDIGVAVETPVGCSMSAGTFTATVAGRWRFSVATQYQGGNTAVRSLYLAKGNAANSPTGVKYGLTGAPSEDAQATGHEITLAAGGTVSVYVAVWTSGGQVTIHRALGNLLTATWLGP
jgi:tail-like repeat protein